MTTQTETAEAINDPFTMQIDQMVDWTRKGYAQAEKAMDLWMTQSMAAVEESRKLTGEWMSAGKTIGDEWVKAYQTQVREAVKLFTAAP